MTLKDIQSRGITKVRRRIWRDQETHIELTRLQDGTYERWCKLVPGPAEAAVVEADKLSPIPIMAVSGDDWEEYKG